MAGAALYTKVCGGVDEFSISTSNVVNYFHVTSHQRHDTSKARVFKLHTIAVVHNCDVEATVAAFTDFSNDLLF